MMSVKRILKELSEIQNHPSPNFSVTTDPKNPYTWLVTLKGPTDTPYSGGKFLFQIELPQDYPFKPPKRVKFLTKIFHPNIDSKGLYCGFGGDVLNDYWSPALTLLSVIQGIESNLIAPSADDALSNDVTEVFRTDKNKFEAIAREWTLKYAQ